MHVRIWFSVTYMLQMKSNQYWKRSAYRSILKVEPINIPNARYCYSFAQYYKLLRDDMTLGYNMDNLVNKVFNLQFDQEISVFVLFRSFAL